MKLLNFVALASSLISFSFAQNFCKTNNHSGYKVDINSFSSNKVGYLGYIGYEMWADSGYNTATFYSDGSFLCKFYQTKDYLCRTGLSFDSTKTHKQIGHIYADYKVVKGGVSGVDYSYIGVYGWSRNPLVEYYIVDNWLSAYRPGDWVGNKKYGNYVIDGAYYTIYENTRYGPTIEGNKSFKQYFSIRDNPKDCSTIDVTAHFNQWEKLGMKLGNLYEVKILGEAGSNGYGASGSVDFLHANVYKK
ncbi:concanavalin A-like lectin/glucanase domain-containing protein [Neocallimastix sp. 'constans']